MIDPYDSIKKGFAISFSFLIIYLSVFSFNHILFVIWIFTIPLIFVALLLYDFMLDKELFERGFDVDFYMSLGGPVTIVGLIFSTWFMLKEIKDEEKYEKSLSEERERDPGSDEHKKM